MEQKKHTHIAFINNVCIARFVNYKLLNKNERVSFLKKQKNTFITKTSKLYNHQKTKITYNDGPDLRNLKDTIEQTNHKSNAPADAKQVKM